MKDYWDCLRLRNSDADKAIYELEKAKVDCLYLEDDRILVDSMVQYEGVLDAAGIEWEVEMQGLPAIDFLYEGRNRSEK